MHSRAELIEKLLQTFHLNVEERAQLGTKDIARIEVVAVIANALKSCDFFPSHARVWVKGSSVFEGYFLQRREPSGCVLHWQRHHPANPHLLAESSRKIYRSTDKAIRAYLAKEYANGIDGIPVS